MGMWSSPFESKQKAEQLVAKFDSPWLIIEQGGDKELPDAYELIGDDDFFDNIQDSAVGTDMRHSAIGYLNKYLENIDSFFKTDKEAVKIIKKLVKNWY